MKNCFVLVFLIVLYLNQECYGHSYSLGSCPVIEPQSSFDMNKMLGLWYVIQKTSTASHCITYNFTKNDEPGEYEVTQDSQHFILGLTPLKHDYRYTGRLTVPDSGIPARMIVKFPLNPVHGTIGTVVFVALITLLFFTLDMAKPSAKEKLLLMLKMIALLVKHVSKVKNNSVVNAVKTTASSISKLIYLFLGVAGSASYTVFTTDYDTYAGIFTCQKLVGFAHRQSATILSRTKELDKMYIEKIRNKLSNANIDPFDLSIISQKNCPSNATEGVNINIDDDTFSPKSIGGVVRKAGEKIGDGVEFVAEGAKKLYGKATESRDVEDVTGRNARYMTENPHTEWLP